MQTQTADALCLTLQLGKIDLVSIPADYLPRRIDWAKWLDCVNMGSLLTGERLGVNPRICISPDHQDAKNNQTIYYLQSQSTLEQVDPVALFSDVADGARFIFVGTWSLSIPAWLSSAQAIFSAKFSGIMNEFLAEQFSRWCRIAEILEKSGSFLVSDDVGRLSGLTGVSRNWRQRTMRTGVLSEVRSPSWFAAVVDVAMSRSANATNMRLHRLLTLDPDLWCGSPKIAFNEASLDQAPSSAGDIWISAPSVGVALWIAEQQGHLEHGFSRIHVPGAILGWNPIRDLLAFLSRARDGSLLYLVDQHWRLQVLKKEGNEL
jgi:hypothetical protein